MKRTPTRTAAQTALLLCAGALLMGSSFFLPGLLYNFFEHISHLDRAFFMLPLVLIGGFVMLRFSMLFKRGITDGSWPETDVEALRTIMNSGLYRAVLVALGVLGLVALRNRQIPPVRMGVLPSRPSPQHTRKPAQQSQQLRRSPHDCPT
jgi:hypothetical protein